MENSEQSSNLSSSPVESSGLTITEVESLEAPNAKPKRKYKRRKKSRKSKRQSKSSNLSAGGSVSSNFEAVAASVPDAIGADPVAGVDPAAAPAAPAPAGADIFETQVEFYLPRFFTALAYVLGEHWRLDEMETRIMVPLGAKSLEEIYPYLPDWIRNAQFKATWAFGATLAVLVAPRVNQTWAEYKLRKAQEQTSPAGTGSDTSMQDSPASSGSSVNLGSARPILRVDSSSPVGG